MKVILLTLAIWLGQQSTSIDSKDLSLDFLCADDGCSPVLTVDEETAQNADTAVVTTFYWKTYPEFGRLLHTSVSVIQLVPDTGVMGDPVPTTREEIEKVTIGLLKTIRQRSLGKDEIGQNRVKPGEKL